MEVLKQQRVLAGLLLLLAIFIAFDVYRTSVERTVEGFGQALNLRVESNVPQMGFRAFSSENLMHLRLEPLRSYSEIASPEVSLYWEDVPEAAYYRVGVAAGRISDLVNKTAVIRYFAETQETEQRINLYEWRWTWWERQYDGAYISPATFLGAFSPGERPLFIVDAISEEGDLVASSMIIDRGGGYASAVYGWHIASDGSTGLAWSEEAQAIREQRFDEALVALQRRLAKNPYDEEALHILFRAYYFGVDRDGRYHNPELAVVYGTRLLELLPAGAVREGYLQRVAEMAKKENIAWVAPEVSAGQEGES